jgi:hypothetical protein
VIVKDELVQKALDHLRLNAGEAAKARAERIYMEEYRKTIKANVMMRHLDTSVAAQEREAYASQDYKDHLIALRDAVERDETFRWKMVAAEATIEAWRTEQANRRSEGKLQ